MKSKTTVLFFIAVNIASLSCFAGMPGQAGRVSEITGVAPNRVAKMAEAMDKMHVARGYARKKQYDQAIYLLTEITTDRGFDNEDERSARLTMVGTQVLAKDYRGAYEITKLLHEEKPLLEDYLNFIKAMSDFSIKKDAKILLDYIELYNSRNKNIIPPKVHDLNYLGRMVRLYEMAGEIDKALELVEEYLTAYFPKNMKREPSALGKKNQKGLKLLKQALLQDKEEGKNTYAQELINTTDYFGFV